MKSFFLKEALLIWEGIIPIFRISVQTCMGIVSQAFQSIWVWYLLYELLNQNEFGSLAMRWKFISTKIVGNYDDTKMNWDDTKKSSSNKKRVEIFWHWINWFSIMKNSHLYQLNEVISSSFGFLERMSQSRLSLVKPKCWMFRSNILMYK